MKKVRVVESNGETRLMYFVHDPGYHERYSFGKEHWLFGEYSYTSDGVMFADMQDALLYQFLNESQLGKMLVHRLELMQEYSAG